MPAEAFRNGLAQRLKQRQRIPFVVHIPRRRAAVADGLYRRLAAERHHWVKIQTVGVAYYCFCSDEELQKNLEEYAQAAGMASVEEYVGDNSMA